MYFNLHDNSRGGYVKGTSIILFREIHISDTYGRFAYCYVHCILVLITCTHENMYFSVFIHSHAILFIHDVERRRTATTTIIIAPPLVEKALSICFNYSYYYHLLEKALNIRFYDFN